MGTKMIGSSNQGDVRQIRKPIILHLLDWAVCAAVQHHPPQERCPAGPLVQPAM